MQFPFGFIGLSYVSKILRICHVRFSKLMRFNKAAACGVKISESLCVFSVRKVGK